MTAAASGGPRDPKPLHGEIPPDAQPLYAMEAIRAAYLRMARGVVTLQAAQLLASGGNEDYRVLELLRLALAEMARSMSNCPHPGRRGSGRRP
jgi:hypothetical protein